jgi:hypothetical protein
MFAVVALHIDKMIVGSKMARAQNYLRDDNKITI